MPTVVYGHRARVSAAELVVGELHGERRSLLTAHRHAVHVCQVVHDGFASKGNGGSRTRQTPQDDEDVSAASGLASLYAAKGDKAATEAMMDVCGGTACDLWLRLC